MLENRRAMTRLLPGLFSSYRVRPVDHYPMLLLNALREVAPTGGEEEPTVVVWTPGPFNSRLLRARVPRAPDGRRARRGLRPRRPRRRCATSAPPAGCSACTRSTAGSTTTSSTRSSSAPTRCSACPGLMRAYRAGTVAIVNAVGTGVADDKAIYHYVPEMIRYYLGEEPILENVPTYLLDDREQREHVLDAARPSWSSSRRASPAARASSSGRPRASEEIARQAAARSSAQPERWIAQELVQLSTVPDRDGRTARSAPRHVDLRPFAVFGDDIHIVPGGLTRVALREGSMIVNSSQGGGSKDTWVLEEAAPPAEAGLDAGEAWSPPPLPGLCSGGRLVLAAAASSSNRHARPDRPRAVLDRPLSWRAPSTPRACSTASSTPTSRAAATTPAGVRLIVGRAAGDHGRASRRAPPRPTATRSLRLLTLDPEQPGLGPLLRHAGARGRAHRARRVLRRDVGGDQHVPPRPAAARRLRRAAAPARTRSTPTCASAAGCSGA